MSKLYIDGYKKIENIRLGDWVCSICTENDNIYTFLFDFSPLSTDIEHQNFFNLIIINRNYQDPDGYKIEVDFNIFRGSGNIETFKRVKELWVYSHNLVTLSKFTDIIKPLLILNA